MLCLQGWPLPASTDVWVMTSTSGASPMTNEQRFATWQALAEHLEGLPWPRQDTVQCCANKHLDCLTNAETECQEADGKATCGRLT